MSILFCSILFLFTMLAGCAEKSKETTELKNGTLTYSNLDNERSQEEVRDAMMQAGIEPRSVERFFRNVDYFNEVVGEKEALQGDFVTIDTLVPDYDAYAMQEQWDAKNPAFLGYNCRITSYDLVKDFVTIGSPSNDNTEWLVFDEMAVEGDQEAVFNPEERQQFRSLYATVPTEATTDVNVHVKNVQQQWEKQHISFENEDKASIISVFFHEEEGFLFIGHIGVLLKTTDDDLLFIEKVAFQEPYQAIKFSNRQQLNDYLMNKYDVSWDQPTAKPFIMENDHLLEGYRENPHNKQGAY